jgi:hypothetical protein
MRTTAELLVRCLIALSVAYGFFALILCLSIIPDIVRGPVGFGKATPSGMVTFLLVLSPVKWFAFGAAPFVFWSAFGRLRSSEVEGVHIAIAVIAFLLGSSALVCRDLLILHATYAVEPAARGIVANGFNAFLVLAIAWPPISSAARRRARSK